MNRLIGMAVGCLCAPFVFLWVFKVDILKRVGEAALFSAVWLMTSKLFRMWGWL